MIVKCPKCGFSSKVPRNQIPVKPTKVRCKKCGTIFVIKRPKPQKTLPIGTTRKISDNKLKVECPQCNFAYVVNPTKLPSGKIKTVCKNCKKPFIFVAKSTKSHKPPPPPPSEIRDTFLVHSQNEDSKPESIATETETQKEPQKTISKEKPEAVETEPKTQEAGFPKAEKQVAEKSPPPILQNIDEDFFKEIDFDEELESEDGSESGKPTSEEIPNLELEGEPPDEKTTETPAEIESERDIKLNQGDRLFSVYDKDNQEIVDSIGILELREMVTDGTVKSFHKIKYPGGAYKPAGKMIELESAFAAKQAHKMSRTFHQETEDTESTSIKDFFSGVSAGALAGIGCGIPFVAISLFFRVGLVADIGGENFSKFIAGSSGGAVLTAGLSILFWITLGTFIGTLISTLHVIALSGDSETYFWDSDIAGFIGGGVGIALGIVIFILQHKFLVLITTPLWLYILARVVALIYGLIYGSHESG